MIQTKVVPQGWIQEIPEYYILYREVIKIKFLQRFVSWNKVNNFLVNVEIMQEMLFHNFEDACDVAEIFQKHPDKLEKHIIFHNKLYREYQKRQSEYKNSKEAAIDDKLRIEKQRKYNEYRNSRYISKMFTD